jgi:hypothetical protein
MILIDNIIESIKEGLIRITDHADEEAANDGLSFADIYQSVRTGEIIEQYPEDKPYPSYLIFGKNEQGEPIHSVWAYNVLTKASVVITVYRPDPEKWLDWKVRRKT